MVKLKRIHGHMMSTGGSFWDLGSGVGKCVIAAAMMHNWEVSIPTIPAGPCIDLLFSLENRHHALVHINTMLLSLAAIT